MSTSGAASATLDRAVATLNAANINVVASSGNFASDACMRSPARAPGALAVGAADIANARAGFSSYGGGVSRCTRRVSTWRPLVPPPTSRSRRGQVRATLHPTSLVHSRRCAHSSRISMPPPPPTPSPASPHSTRSPTFQTAPPTACYAPAHSSTIPAATQTMRPTADAAGSSPSHQLHLVHRRRCRRSCHRSYHRHCTMCHHQ